MANLVAKISAHFSIHMTYVDAEMSTALVSHERSPDAMKGHSMAEHPEGKLFGTTPSQI